MGKYPEHKLPIKSWADDDKPREKLLSKGAEALSDAELIAILFGSGSREESAVALSQRILRQYDNNVNDLGRVSLDELIRFKGIGPAKAITLLAALELGRRRQHTEAKALPIIGSSQDAFHILQPLVADLDHEQFYILFLNRANKVMGHDRVSAGGVSGTVVDPKIIFRKALSAKASGIILCHNHPSGNLKPSQADRDITHKLFAAGKHLEINVIDHLIITHSGYFSFADEGILR